MDSRDVFQNSPVAIWEEDFSSAKIYLQEKLKQEKKTFNEFISDNQDELLQIASRIRIIDVNKAALKLYKARNKSHFIEKYSDIFHEETMAAFMDFIEKILGGEVASDEGIEVAAKTFEGEKIFINLSWSLGTGKANDASQLWFYAIDITDKKTTEEEIHATQFTIDNAAFQIFWLDKDANIVYGNKEACESLGYTKEELLCLKLFDFAPEPHQPWEKTWSVMKERGTYTFETMHTTKTGIIIPVEVTSTFLAYEGKEFLCAFARDISYRKKSEELARRSESRFLSLFKNMMEGVAIHDLVIDKNGKAVNYRLIDVNDRYEKILGIKKEDVVGKLASDAYGTEEAPYLSEFSKVVSSGEQFLFDTYFQPMDKHFRISVSKTGETSFATIFSDITEMKKSEVLIRENAKLLRNIIDSSTDYIFVKDKELRTLICNKVFAEAVGKTPEEMLGKTDIENGWSQVFVKGDPEKEVKGWEQDDLKALSGEFVHVTSEPANVGEDIRAFDTVKIPLKNDSEEIIGILGIARDITEQILSKKQAENLKDQLLHSQKMEAIGILAGGVAHDFNNILGIIMGSAQLARYEVDEVSEAANELAIIVDSAKRAKDLTTKLLTFARKEEAQKSQNSIKSIVDHVAELMERTLSKHVNIKTIVKDDMIILCDPNQLHQAIMNLCTNAADAMPSGGDLMIECRESSFHEGVCDTCGEELIGKYCIIQVSDTGVGIAENMIPKVTDPFFTTKGVGKGTGLGMSVTLGIVNNHDGHMHIYSEYRKGTCVKIYLPADDVLEIEGRPVEIIEEISGDETILIIDDEKLLLEMAGRILKKRGYTPVLASGGKEGIDLYKENSEKISVVVLDLMMPEMDGPEVFSILREINADVKVVFASGYSINGQAQQLLGEGNHRFVQKPFDVAEICATIRDVIDGRK